MIVENFLNPRKELDIQIHKANRTPYYTNTKRPSPRTLYENCQKSTRILKKPRKKESNLQRYSHKAIS